VAAACDTLGWHWWPADNAIISEDYRGRPACNNCAGCRSGCPRGSLSTAAVWWAAALACGVDLRVGARVERITTDARGRADGAIYIDLDSGARHRQRASVVVLCANGLGTPRLLLLSADARHPDGLSNSSGLVGRYLMHHAWAGQTLIFPEAADSFAGAFGAPLMSEQFYETDSSRGFVNGFLWQFHRGFPAAQSALATSWGAGHRAAFAERFGHDLWVWLQAEDLPVYSNRVELDPTRHDSSGLPGVRVTRQLHANDHRILEFGRARAAELAGAAGAQLRPADSAAPNPGWHLLGTARMGVDPATSVVDAQHQAWDVPNLYICDGSSFVTCGAANPTSTIGALALRCADGIASRA
jgi:choline dehydrogenase-like flavoprotein